MLIEGVIFDMDGTLGDTVYVSVEAIIRAVKKFTGKMYTHPEIITRFGPTEQGILRQLLPEDVWEPSYKYFLQQYEALHQTGDFGIYPGMQDVLRLLADHAVHQAIVTGKGRRTTEFSLRYFGLESAFETVETGWLDSSSKEACINKVVSGWQTRPDKVLYVGDAPTDIAIARRAGVLPVSAVWADTADADELAAEEPYRLFERVSDLAEWLRDQLNGVPPQEEPHVS
ncbi:MAG: HAD hydrolase-like protein [Anaerolineales bacterium]|jgi:pyrophosphatase PpaX